MNYWQEFIRIIKDTDITPIANFLNLLLVFATALVTFLAWRASKRANELQLLPLLSIYFRGRALKDRTVRIRNIGKTPAYDIKIENYKLILTDVQKIWELSFYMNGTNVLVPDEERDLNLSATENGRPAEIVGFLIFNMDPEEEHDRKRIDITLTFRNAEGKSYYSQIETGKGGLFVKPAKIINWRGKIYLKYRKFYEFLLLNWYKKIIWKMRQPYVRQPQR